MKCATFLTILFSAAALAAAQCGPDKSRPYPRGESKCPPGPPRGGGGGGGEGPAGGGGGGGMSTIKCSTSSNLKADSKYIADASGAKAAALRGNIGCIDMDVLKNRPTAGRGSQTANNVYGAMEAGFTKDQPPMMSCLGSNTVPGGIDTGVAELMVAKYCNKNPEDSDFRTWASKVGGLDACGGHAQPYHYHQPFMGTDPSKCNTYSNTASGHSTRIATAGDGNGIYGPNIDGGCEPIDLDVCGGRTGVTPDSDGKKVYYYVAQRFAPFTVGCFGPPKAKDIEGQLAECRKLYSSKCSATATDVTTAFGTGQYILDCPCFHPTTHANVKQTKTGQLTYPAFLDPKFDPTKDKNLCKKADTVTTTKKADTVTTKKAGTVTKKPDSGGSDHLCNIAKMQAPHLKAMLDMTDSRKKEACAKLDGFKKQVGDEGVVQIMKCAGDFPQAYKDAKAFCGTGGAGGGGSTKKPGSGSSGAGNLCNIAKMQAPHLKAMLDMTDSRKKEACAKLDGFKKQVGDEGVVQIMKCAGDFPQAYKDAKAFCGTGGAGGGGSTKKSDTVTTKKAGAGPTLPPPAASDGADSILPSLVLASSAMYFF